mmetsp:Transcript_4178/g.7340  ORF Transcript_4178/g.7340 Transcript_4178/m.7340 type:complete len:102 (+) Transcript_4178:57-362(+)
MDKIASAMRGYAARYPQYIAKGSDPLAYKETEELAKKLVITTMDAFPDRLAAARSEWTYLKGRLLAMDPTVDEAKSFAWACVHLTAFYFLGKMIGSRSNLQ